MSGAGGPAGLRELAEWARAAFGLGEGTPALRPAGRGAEARVYLLEVGPARYALKQPFGTLDEQGVRREAAFLDHFARAGVEVPVHQVDADGRHVVPVPRELGGGVVRLSRWVEGEPVRVPTADVAGPLGVLLGALHVAAPPAGGDPGPWYTTCPDDSTWDDLLRRSAGMPWCDPLEARLPDLAHHGALVRAAGPPSGPLLVGHRDLHPENVLRAPDGALRALDWEDAGPVDPGRELAKVLVQWHVDGGTVDVQAVRTTVAAYRAAGGRGRVDGPGAFAMVLSTEPNFLAAQVERALDASLADDLRQHAVGEVLESLGYLPTPAALEAVLAAAMG